MPRTSVLITDCDLPGRVAEEVLEEAGFHVIRLQTVDPTEIAEAGSEAEAAIVQWSAIDGDVLDRLPQLRMISRLGIGYDMIDVGAATERGVAVANTPTYCIEEVAAHTLSMIMALGRGLPGYQRQMTQHQWAPTRAVPFALRPSASVVATIGYGRIGRVVAQMCAALGFRTLVVDPVADASVVAAAGHELVELDTALTSADVVTLHAPLTEKTRHMINAAALCRMRGGAVLVNTCRGALVDEAALVDSLDAGHLGGAALDVFEREPLDADHPLRGRENVILTPHAAWYSAQSLLDLPREASTNVVDFLAGRDVPSIVNPGYGDEASLRAKFESHA